MRSRAVIVVGVVGILVGVVLAAGPRDSETGLMLAIGLALFGLSLWHARSWGLGKLVGIGLLALGELMLHLADYGSGEWVWNQGRSGDDLIGNWVVIASAMVVLGGCAWSLAEEVAMARDRTDEVDASLAFWRKWWMPLFLALVGVWVVGILTAQIDYSSPDDDDEIEVGTRVPDEWSIVTHVGDDGDSSRLVHMIMTIDRDAADIERLGGRLVWPGFELELCGVDVVSAAEGEVQVGGYFLNTERCEPEWNAAFDDHGLPDTGCLSVRIDGADDERCAPLALDDSATVGP